MIALPREIKEVVDEAKSSLNGFKEDTDRRTIPTDYSIAMGAYTNEKSVESW